MKDFARTFRNKVTKRYKRKAAKPRYICIENSSSILEEAEPQNDAESSSQNQSANQPEQTPNQANSQNGIKTDDDDDDNDEVEERETPIVNSSYSL